MEVAPPLHMPLQTIMSDKASVWESIQQKHGLEKHSYESVSSWGFGDFVFHGIMTFSLMVAKPED